MPIVQPFNRKKLIRFAKHFLLDSVWGRDNIIIVMGQGNGSRRDSRDGREAAPERSGHRNKMDRTRG